MSMGELLSKLFRQSILHRFFFRGCMSARRFYRSENMIIGPAVDEAAEYHTLPEWSGVSTCPSASKILTDAKQMTATSYDFFIQYGIPLKSMIEKNGWALSWANHQNEDQKMKLRPSCMTRLGCLTVFRHISKSKILWISTTGQLPVKATGQSQLRQSLGDPDTYEPGYVDRGFGCEPEGDNFVPPPLFGDEEDDSASDDEDAGASEDEDTQAPGGEDDSGNEFAGEDESGSDEEDSSSGSEDESGGDKEGSTFG